MWAAGAGARVTGVTIGSKPRPGSAGPGLAVVIPTLNAARHLDACLAALAPLGAEELVVADGGSRDATCAIAARHGARVIVGPPGRGPQLAAAAATTRAPWLLFQHADSRLDAAACAAARRFITAPDNRTRAGYFRFALDHRHPFARWVEVWAALRCRLFALPFGDQGLVISRALYHRIGGYPPIPLMEDVAIVDRLGRRHLVALDGRNVTSAERYRSDGYLHRGLRNLVCFALYRFGVAPARLVAFYRGRPPPDAT